MRPWPENGGVSCECGIWDPLKDFVSFANESKQHTLSFVHKRCVDAGHVERLYNGNLVN